MSRPGRSLSRKILLRKARLRELEARTPPSLSLISNVKDLDNHIPLSQNFSSVQANHHNDPSSTTHFNHNDHPIFTDFRSPSMEAESISSSHNISSLCVHPDLTIGNFKNMPPNPMITPNPLILPNPVFPTNTCQGHSHHHHHYNHHYNHPSYSSNRNELLAILNELRFMTKRMKVRSGTDLNFFLLVLHKETTDSYMKKMIVWNHMRKRSIF